MGSGYASVGDACIARNLEDEARLARWLSRDGVAGIDAEFERSSRHLAVSSASIPQLAPMRGGAAARDDATWSRSAMSGRKLRGEGSWALAGARQEAVGAT